MAYWGAYCIGLFMSRTCGFDFAVALTWVIFTCALAHAQEKLIPHERPIAGAKVEPPVSYPLASEAEQANERRIQTALAKQISFDWKDAPLKDVVAQLADECDITIVLTKKIEDAGVTRDQPITQKLTKISLRSCLRLILGDLNLTYITKDEVIKITTIEDALSPENMTIRLYPVQALVERVSSMGEAKPALDFKPLIGLVEEIEPDSWQEVGGPGIAKGFENGACLFISQRDDIHESIERLLITIRRVKAVQGLKDAANPTIPNHSPTPVPVGR